MSMFPIISRLKDAGSTEGRSDGLKDPSSALLSAPGKRLSFSTRLAWYEAMAVKMSDRETLSRAIRALWRTETYDGTRRTRSRYASALSSWAKNLSGHGQGRGSTSLSEMTRGYIPDIERILLHMGETSAIEDGNIQTPPLELAFRSAKEVAKLNQTIKQTAVGSWVYPLFLIEMIYGQFLLSAYTRHQFSLGFGADINYTGYVGTYVALSEFILRMFLPFQVSLVVGAIVLIFLLPRWSGRSRKWADRHVPIFRGYKAVQGCQVLSVVAEMVGMGKTETVGIGELIQYANPWLKAYLIPIHDLLVTTEASLPSVLYALGGDFPSPESTRRLREYQESRHYATSAVRVLTREAHQIVASLNQQIKLVGGFLMIISAVAMILCFAGDTGVTEQLPKILQRAYVHR